MLFKCLKLDEVIFFVVLCIGIVVIVWMVFCFWCDFESVYVEVFWMKINVFIEDVIKKLFKKKYGKFIKDFVYVFVKGELKEEIVNFK